MSAKKILLGYSGGIDSTFAAKKLSSQGYQITALTLDTTGDVELLRKARSQAEIDNIPWMSVDVREKFQTDIIQYFLDEYSHGRTPAPCTLCNAEIKWKTLYEECIKLGYDHIATGHYFNVKPFNGKLYVSKAVDKSKDQSYYLWMLPQNILQRIITPMGDEIKAEIKNNLPADASRSESMGVCFLNGDTCEEFILKNNNVNYAPGIVKDIGGSSIGHHKGVAFYTIGQKKGLDYYQGIGGLYINQIDYLSNTITVGTKNLLEHTRLIVGNWLANDKDELLSSKDINVKIRGFGHNPEGFCSIAQKNGKLHVCLQAPAWAPAPGQPIVFYRGDRVIGGGFLDSSTI